MAGGQGMNLLKQFHSSRTADTSLKRGVNEIGAQWHVRPAMESFISSTPDFSRVCANAGSGNRFNGFQN
jgi:hypothetical protein